ncbi:MAG: hypothetical protein QNJ72_11635 [Pleurocapsa sp. MO_226.B13]|nr:hypothetical protein [Pleurocapsa sp. MO_226.B13]
MNTKSVTQIERKGKVISIIGFVLLGLFSIGYFHFKERSQITWSQLDSTNNRIWVYDQCLRGSRFSDCNDYSRSRMINIVEEYKKNVPVLSKKYEQEILLKNSFFYSTIPSIIISAIGILLIIGRNLAFINNHDSMNTYNQAGNIGVGHFSGGEIKHGANVAGKIINKTEKQNLIDAAQEIQNLLNQLSNSYHITTSKDKNIVVGEAVDQIENNNNLKTKVTNALKSGGTEAFKEAINHPLANILISTIEGWRDID